MNNTAAPQPDAFQVITEDEFDALYPSTPAADGGFFWEYHDLPKDLQAQNVFTAVDGDDGRTYLLPGYHVVNAFGYVVTTKPWRADDFEVVLDDLG